MKCRTSIFALLAAAMTFAAGGVGITVYESVDAHIGSVMVSAGSQHETVNRSGSFTWGSWYADTAYTASASNVDPGYTARWKVTKSGLATKEGAINQPITLSSDYSGCALSFYGQPNTYAVTLDRQSGNGGTSSVTATYDAAMPSATMPTRTGYTFGGYYTAVNGGGTQYYTASGTSATNWNRTAATTLYAKWTANHYTVTLKANNNQNLWPLVNATFPDGTANDKAFAVTYDQKYPTLVSGVPSSPGYTFKNWYDSTSGTHFRDGVQLDDLTVKITTSRAFWAQWKANTYTVTLDRQSGSGGSSSVTATYGAAMPSISLPTRAGYTFGGYYTAANGGGTQYYTATGASAQKWNQTSATTLYAKWTANRYTVTLKANSNTNLWPLINATFPDGTANDKAFAVTYDQKYPRLSSGVPSSPGYTFKNWYDATSGTHFRDGVQLNDLTVKITQNSTFQAVWTANTYTVTLDRQSGSGGSSSATATYGAAMPSITPPTRAGYTFGGYYTAANGGGTQYYTAAGASARRWNQTSALTLYAKWTAKSYTVTLKANNDRSVWPLINATFPDGTANDKRFTATYDQKYPTLVSGVPSSLGYTFKNWYDVTSGTHFRDGVQLNDLTVKITQNSTFQAVWTANVYRVTFNANGGSVAPSVKDVEYGKPYGTLPTPTRENRSFDGWFTAPGDGERVTPSTAYAITEAQTLYAHWTQESYVVNYKALDRNGVEIGGGFQTIGMGVSATLASFSSLKIKLPDGYSFAEWNTAPDGFGDSLDDEVSVFNLTNEANATVMLYAQWSPNPYEVAFHPNGADWGETMPNQSFTYDVTQNLNHVEFTYTGYAFKEWSTATNHNYQTTNYVDGAEVVNLATGGVVNLYANWTGIVYTVSFDANGGAGAMDPMVCTYGVPTNLPPCTFTCGSWEFQGWTTNAWTTNGVKDVYYRDGARVTNLTATAEVTLRACWKGPVTLDARDARGDGVITNVDEAVSVTNLFVGEKWDLPGATNANPHLVFEPPNNGWCYWNAQSVMTCLPAYVQPDTTNLVVNWKWVADELAIAVDAPELEFSTFGTRGNVAEPGNSSVSAYSADWFVQSNFVHGSTNAVQSGALPENTPEGTPPGLVYVSWLTTTVKGKGVLSFWWKYDAQPAEAAPGGDNKWYGDSFRFGLFDSEKGITNENEIVQLKEPVDWSLVAYTNETDATVSFAWAFVYTDGARNNGGGTGWVDRVRWTTNGSVSAEVTLTHKVAYSWLRTTFPDYASATDAALENLAESQSPGESLPPGKTWPNGEPVMVWQDYWAGTNPNDPNDLFRADIVVSNNVPYISWQPDLRTNDPPRVYHVLCAPTPSAQEWVKWLGPGDSGASTNRFFKVKLVLEEE